MDIVQEKAASSLSQKATTSSYDFDDIDRFYIRNDFFINHRTQFSNLP